MAETEALPVVDTDGLQSVADGPDDGMAQSGPARAVRRRRAAVIAAVGVVLALAAAYAGGCAYAAHRLDAEKASYAAERSAYIGKTGEARNLAKSAKGKVLDVKTIDALNTAAGRRLPAPGQARPWALWEEIPVLHGYAQARATLGDDAKAIDQAIAEVRASQSSKRVKDAKDMLSNADGAAKKLLADSNGKVADNRTRDALSAAISGADKTLKTPGTGLKPGLAEAYTAALKPLADASRQVNDSMKTKSDADAKAAADAAAAQAQAAAQSQGAAQSTQSYAQTPAYGNYSGAAQSYAGGGTGYQQPAAPRQQAQPQAPAPANNGGGQQGGSSFNWDAWVAEQNKNAIILSPTDRCKVFGDCSGLN
ncbi:MULTISPECIES: hypothetical protein [Bifidobacterium]|jgi:hypothetical protein|uniref:Membrane protein involved in colicin uptake n=3 Tax=Bifidobacterium TaxID=1678 RepID=A0A087E964_9BIFI|nr:MULTISPECIES: hypothetical protein [Bifidobacterium]KAE8128727.1 hypothetical protein DDE84_04495 [Bifidobacterium tibiigranuli]KAE8128918.1 hypothetical protein DDF78_04285 [Bifidobacterium tibiigranuli]KFJ04315.1 membrane protein involved in colicin uptake [Bifidobacterium subtile]QOL36498.1 hypothetical protein BS3272_00290 [Bifidobacterium subtile]